jgi:mRNA-degrading endonuclease toxin of MazEF toxin-antitoxin module
LDQEAGLSGHEVSYVHVTDLHTLPKGKLRKQRGRLSLAELGKVEGAIRAYLGL